MKWKKSLAALLAATMLLSAMPLTVFADDAGQVVEAADISNEANEPSFDVFVEPEPSSDLEAAATPEPSSDPEAMSTPEPTAEPTETPEATPTPEPNSTPEVTVTPEPSSTPEATATPELAATPVPVEDPYAAEFAVIESEIGAAHAWPVPDCYNVTQKYSDSHPAWDIGADTGTPVVATDDGTVTITQVWNGIVTEGDNNSYGHMVQITHADGTVTLYAHMSEINVREGDTVVRGQQIGRVGQTGNADGPHLHFEVITAAGKADPDNYFEAESSAEYTMTYVSLLEQGISLLGVGDKGVTVIRWNTLKTATTTTTTGALGQLPSKGMISNGVEYPAYCLNHDKLVWGDVDYTWTDLTFSQQSTIRALLAEGYSEANNLDTGNSSTHTAQWLVTQCLVWAAEHGYIVRQDDDHWTWSSQVDADMETIAQNAYNPTEVRSFYNKVKQNVLNAHVLPSYAASTASSASPITLRWDGSKYTATVTDSNGVGGNYSWSHSGVTFTKSGDKLTISTTSPLSGTVSVKGTREIGSIDDIGWWTCSDSAMQNFATPFASKATKTAYIRLITEETTWDITLTKTSANVSITNGNSNYSLAGAVYNVYKAYEDPSHDYSKDPVVATFTTNTSGQANLSKKLEDNRYAVIEETAPKGHVLDKTVHCITIKGGNTTMHVVDDPVQIRLTIRKKDSITGLSTPQGNASLAGAVYAVTYMENGVEKTVTGTTNSAGVVIFSNIPLGTLKVQEQSPPPGYKRDTQIHTYTVTSAGVEAVYELEPADFTEQVILNKISITKYADMVNGDDVPEEGAVFEVYLKSAGSYANAKAAERDRITTNASGYAITKDMPFGTYVLHQVSGSAGRELAPDQEVTISEDKSTHATYAVTITNSLKLGDLEILKTSEDGIAEGWEFKITRDIDDWSLVVKTGADGKAVAKDLPVYADVAGKQPIRYTVTEINVEDKYKQPEPQTVTLTEHAVVTVNVENLIARGSIQLLKVDHDGVTPLEGAVYRFWYEDGTEIATATTDKDGKIAIENILYSKFYYQEQTPPEGYDRDETVYEASVDYDGHVITVTRENVPSVGSITARKVDTHGNPLSGVSFALEFSTDDGTTWNLVTAREEGSKVSIGGCDSPGLVDGILTTGEDGTAAFTGLQVDNQTVTILYRLTEVSTQNGATLMKDTLFEGSLPAEIDGEKVTDVTITAVNGRNFELPGAGGDGFPFLPIGIFFVVTALCAAFFITERGKKIMKKTKLFAQLGAIMLAVVMCFGVVTASAATVPDATIDTTRPASLELYKYDFTSANADGVLTDSTYVSTGLKNDAAEAALAPYAIQGVVYTYAKVADIMTYSEQEADGYKDMVLYALPDNSQSEQFLAALGLSRADAYRIDHNELQFMSDALIDGLAGQLGSVESQTKNALEAYVRNNGGTDMPETDAYGHSSVSGLAQGLYVVVESYVPENVTSTTAPFLVSLPMTTIDGDNWNYDVVIYPKNETGMPTLEKTLREAQADTGKHNGTTDDIADGYTHTATGSDGDVIDYQIISTLPTITSNATALTTYTYVDTLSKGIEYNNPVKIEWYMDSACKQKITEWTEADGKFDVAYGTAADDATTMTVTMTEAGLDEINNSAAVYDLSTSIYRGYSNCTMRITYTATVNSSADVVYGDNGNPNTVTLEWRRTNMDYYDTLEDDCHFYSYGIDLLKQFEDGKGDVENVEFKVWNNTDKYWVTAELNAAEGIYYVKDHVAEETDATVFIPMSDSKKIVVKGLEDDEYILTEIATDDKYLLLRESIKVKITAAESDEICAVCGKPGLTATATVNGDPVTMTEDNGSASAIVPFKVTNVRGPEMPKTGDRGTWLYAAGGIMLISLAAGGILICIKRHGKQSEEK